MSWAEDEGYDAYDEEDYLSNRWMSKEDWIEEQQRLTHGYFAALNDFKAVEIKNTRRSKMTNTQLTTKVITGLVRLSFVHLLEPAAMEDGGEPKYSTMILIPKDDKETIKKINAAIEAAKDLGKDKLKGVKDPKTTLHDGDEEMDTEERPEFAGHYFMNLSSKTKPGIVDRYRDKLEDPEKIYSGVYARVSMNFYAYNSHGNKGISAGLNNVQIIKDGDYLGGRASAESDFDEFEDDDDIDDLM